MIGRVDDVASNDAPCWLKSASGWRSKCAPSGQVKKPPATSPIRYVEVRARLTGWTLSVARFTPPLTPQLASCAVAWRSTQQDQHEHPGQNTHAPHLAIGTTGSDGRRPPPKSTSMLGFAHAVAQRSVLTAGLLVFGIPDAGRSWRSEVHRSAWMAITQPRRPHARRRVRPAGPRRRCRERRARRLLLRRLRRQRRRQHPALARPDAAARWASHERRGRDATRGRSTA